MMNLFPVLNKDVQLIFHGETSRVISRKQRFKEITVNKDASRMLSICDGTKCVSEVVEEVLERKPVTQELKNVENFLLQLRKKTIIIFEDCQVERPVHAKGSLSEIYPQVVSLELTDKCNFNCRYCYQNSTVRKNKFLQNPIELLQEMQKKNVVGFELTGGEPLMHPQLEEIISFITANYSLLGIITNGSLLRERHLQLLKNRKCKVAMQVCLDGNCAEVVEETTGVKGSFEMEVNAIKLIKAHGFVLRVGMVVDSPEKIDIIEDTLLLARDLGVDSFIANPTVNFGRGKNIPEKFTIQDHLRLNDVIAELMSKYRGFFSKEMEYIDVDFKLLHNCGAGHKNLTINWDGIIKPCPMVSADELSVGPWQSIEHADTQKKFHAYFKLAGPKEDVCGDCKFFAYCYNCMSRALKASENQPDCAWRKKNKELIEEILK